VDGKYRQSAKPVEDIMDIIKTFARKIKLYPGDKTIQIMGIMENGSSIGLMNLTPIYYMGKNRWENDRNGYIFTITEAKKWCKDNFNKLV